jgi:hypothetical protein
MKFMSFNFDNPFSSKNAQNTIRKMLPDPRINQGFNFADNLYITGGKEPAPKPYVPKLTHSRYMEMARQIQKRHHYGMSNIENPNSKPVSFSTALKMATTGKSRADIEQSSRSSDAKLKKISVARAQATANFWKSGGGASTMQSANSIRAQLGQKPIEVKTRRRRQGRYTTYTTADPVGVLNEHYRKQSLVKWAKEHGLEIDPNKEVTIQTGIKTMKKSYSRVIHNGRRVYGSYNYDVPITKKVKFKDAPSAYKTNFLFEKLGKESSVKKERYLKLYEPLDKDLNSQIAELESKISELRSTEKKMTFYRYRSGSPASRAQGKAVAPIRDAISKATAQKKELEATRGNVQYNYYSIDDEELKQAEQYKQDLVSGIDELNKTQDDMTQYLARTPFADSASKIDDDSPKQRYLAYQHRPESELGQQAKAEIDPIVSSLSSRISTVDSDATKQENANLQNAIEFVSGKVKNFRVNNTTVAVRDNLGHVEIKDEAVFNKYLSNLPKVYHKPKDEDVRDDLIPELESKYDKETDEYSDIEKKVSKRQRAEAELGNVTAPRRLPSFVRKLQMSKRGRR